MAIKIYSYKKNKKVSTHFYSNGFASTNGSKLYDNKILIDEELVKYLEKFFDYGISIYITSGYRTPEHDKAVGGNGKGAHTYGFAADIIGYVNGKAVPSSYMCCYAQLIGFSGIGVIDSEAIHVDRRTAANYNGNSHWWGDERRATRTDNISSFFKYFKLTEDEVKYKYKKKSTPKKEVKKETKISVTYKVWDDVQNTWLPKVKDNKDYAGIFGHNICAFQASLSKGNIIYRVHTKKGKWLPAVKNTTDYAGIYNKPIDAITMKTDTGKKIYYRVHLRRSNKWLKYINGYSTKNSKKYAGVLNEEIDAIQIYIK